MRQTGYGSESLIPGGVLMSEIFVSIVGVNHYFGAEIFSVGQRLKLVKDYDNRYDDEAIMVEIEGVGKVGYVANSTYTVARGTRSAGRIYDSFEKITYCEVVFIVKDTIIAKLLSSPGVDKWIIYDLEFRIDNPQSKF